VRARLRGELALRGQASPKAEGMWTLIGLPVLVRNSSPAIRLAADGEYEFVADE
jgi:hypothetical protein